MTRSRIFLIAILFIAFASNAQITKGNWMMGGSVGFSNFKSKDTGTGNSATNTSFGLNPNIGYFFIDKLAVGAVGQLEFSNTIETVYGFAPFVRYYFLEKEKQINIFSEASYGFLKFNHSDFKLEKFNLKAGTVFFLNNSVGIEATLNYSNQKTSQNIQTSGVYLGVGFQIHLEREK
jgi:hypothetical protein